MVKARRPSYARRCLKSFKAFLKGQSHFYVDDWIQILKQEVFLYINNTKAELLAFEAYMHCITNS